MKKLFIIIIIILGAYIFKIPKYNELNNLAIIESIAVEYDGTNYNGFQKQGNTQYFHLLQTLLKSHSK